MAGMGMRMTIARIAKKFPAVKVMTTESLAALMNKADSSSNGSTIAGTANKDLLILDSRSEEEFVVSHIPGGFRVDYEAEGESIVQSVPAIHSSETKTVVCYCSIGFRASVVAEKIDNYFMTEESKQTEPVNVYNLEGSLFKWASEGRPMIDANSNPTKYTHPYNSVFGKLINSELRKKELDI